MRMLKLITFSLAVLLVFAHGHIVDAGESSDKKAQTKTSEDTNVKEDFKTLKKDAKEDSKQAGSDIKGGFKKMGDAFKKEDKK